jgi:hypothetical protein
MMAWWEGDGLDRPLVISPLRKPGAASFKPEDYLPTEEARDLDENYRLAWSRHYLESRLFLAEAAPFAGTDYASALCMVGAMAGARVHYTDDTGTAWMEPEEKLFDRPLPTFRAACPPYAFAVSMIHRHAEAFGYDCILGADHMLDPLTTLSMMRGPGQLCLDLVERPETVKRWRTRLGDLFLQIAAGFRAARAQHGRREHMNWTGIWGPGDIEALQCDFSTMLSPEMFHEFAMPELEREAAFYDYALWHLDGASEIRHLDAICSVKNLRAIQWVDEKKYGPIYYLDLFRRIRKLGRSLTLTCPSPDVAVDVTRALGKDGLAFHLMDVKSPKALETLLKRLKAV